MGHTCRGRLLPLAREGEEHAGEAANVLKPQRGHKWVRLVAAYLLVVGTTTEGLEFIGDEEATAEEFREVAERVARGTDMLGKVGGKPPQVKGSVLVGRVS